MIAYHATLSIDHGNRFHSAGQSLFSESYLYQYPIKLELLTILAHEFSSRSMAQI